MKSKASFKSHPIHPILVGFPIAFFTGTYLFDCAQLFTADILYESIARYMESAGVISGLMAAIPGVLDFLYTVPPESTAKKRAAKHGLINGIMLILFSLALGLRINIAPSVYIIFGLETIGMTLIGIAGWLGGTLVYRNQIGVDHRYADAGKWREETLSSKESRIELVGIDSLKLDQMKLIKANGIRIAIARTEKGFLAIDDRCSHRGASLADGVVICGTVQCPWHGSQFNLETGKVKAGPAIEAIKTYKVSEKAGKYYLEL